MGVADQMLLNQVTIFNPPSSSSRSHESSYTQPNKSKSADHPQVDNSLYEEGSPYSRYAFGWADPREIYEDKK